MNLKIISLTHLVAVDASENLAVSALVAVVLLDGILFEGFAAGIASEEHHFLVSLDQFHRRLATFIYARISFSVSRVVFKCSCLI